MGRFNIRGRGLKATPSLTGAREGIRVGIYIYIYLSLSLSLALFGGPQVLRKISYIHKGGTCLVVGFWGSKPYQPFSGYLRIASLGP